MREIVIIAHDMRSTHNVGSLLRTADGLGIKKVYLTGYTPYPLMQDDTRLPHISDKLHHQITKTALGAEESVAWEYKQDPQHVLSELQAVGFSVTALEQTPLAHNLVTYEAPHKIALVLGNEVTGLPGDILKLIPSHVFIPMFGRKESFNVVQAAAMALYELKFH